MKVSQFRLLITEVGEPTEIVNRGKVIGVYTPMVTGDAVPNMTKGRPKRTKEAKELVDDINKEPLDTGW